MRDEGPGTIYFLVPGVSSFVVHSDAETEGLIESIRAELRALAPESALYQVRTMQSYVEEVLAPARLIMVLAGVFAVVALLLAAVGLYGVVSYAARSASACTRWEFASFSEPSGQPSAGCRG